MRTLTVSVPDEVYRRARLKAAEQGRSVSALVAEFLSTLGETEKEVLAEIDAFRAGDRLDRDELHERAVR